MALIDTLGESRRTELGRWGGSLCLVLLAHVAVSAFILRNIETPSAPPAPPAVVMVDLPVDAILPTADSVQAIASEAVAEVTPTEIVEATPPVEDIPDEVPVEEVTEAVTETVETVEPVQEVSEAVPETVAEVKPVETQVKEAEIAELVEPVETTVAKPVENPPEKKEVAKPRPKPKPKPVQQSASNASNNSRASSGAGRPNKQVLSRYLSEVRARILRHRRAVPSSVRGRAVVSFTITRSGGLSGIRLARSSGHAALDRAAVDIVRRVGRVNPIPAQAGRSSVAVSVPFSFNGR